MHFRRAGAVGPRAQRRGRPGNRRSVELLTRDGCTICTGAATLLAKLADELGFALTITDVDAAAVAGDPALRAEFGDRLPVVLLDGAEHSYWEVDERQVAGRSGEPIEERANLVAQLVNGYLG